MCKQRQREPAAVARSNKILCCSAGQAFEMTNTALNIVQKPITLKPPEEGKIPDAGSKTPTIQLGSGTMYAILGQDLELRCK